MDPAYHIPLTQDHLAMLGELTAIIGLVDDEMVKLVAHLLKVDRQAANAIMGSTSVAANSNVWAETIRSRVTDVDVLWLVKHVTSEIASVSGGRNDFVHAVFSLRTVMMPSGFGAGPFGVASFGGPSVTQIGPPFARRVKTGKTTSVEDLPALRDRAARLSCLVAHISHVVAGNSPETSAWHAKLAPSLPPRPETEGARKGKAPQDPPRSSEG